MLFNKLILKGKLQDIGIEKGDWRQGLLWGGSSLVVVGTLFVVATYFFGILKNYTVPAQIINSYKNFLFYEFLLVIPTIFIYDFFFRGFIMLTLKNKITYWAIIVQALLFLILVMATGSFNWSLAPYLISAPLAGVIVYKSRSVFYSTIFQFIIIIILDATIVRLIK
jgi:membrane protease YdiL (CAAX protease family)